MRRAVILVALAISAPCLSGCGTMWNCWSLSDADPENDGRPYGGVAGSLQAAKIYGDDAIHPTEESNRALSACLAAYAFAIDTPLSAVFDTVTLPLFAIAAIEDAQKEAKKKRLEEEQTKDAVDIFGGKRPQVRS